MFALALFDCKERTLTLARDRCGKKPLYFGWDKGVNVFAFASELKAFTAVQAFRKPDINNKAIQLYLQWRYIPDPHSIYENIWKLPPAQFITRPLEDFIHPFTPQEHAETYWHFESVTGQERQSAAEHSQLNGLEDILTQAIKERMIADVSLGVFLSGGVDSALITALMQKHADQPVKSFTIAFDDSRYNEAPHAAQISAHLGTEHTEMLLTSAEAMKTARHINSLFDEPFGDPSAIPTYHVCRLAKKELTVALTGDGGDETFGGYSWYFRAQKLLPVLKLPNGLRRTVGQALTALPLAGGLFSAAQRRKISALIAADDPDELYPLLHSYWSGVTGQRAQNIDDTAYGSMIETLPVSNPIERMMAFDTRMFMAGDVLTKTDRCSMAHGLELRSPLLDHRVIEYGWSMSHDMKIRGHHGKYALKQLLRRYIPDALIDRPKQGFSIPHGRWLREDLRDWAEDMLCVSTLKKHSLIDPDFVSLYWDAHASGQADYGHYLWTIVCLQNWAETCR